MPFLVAKQQQHQQMLWESFYLLLNGFYTGTDLVLHLVVLSDLAKFLVNDVPIDLGSRYILCYSI